MHHWTWRCDLTGAWPEAPSLSCPRCPAGACRPVPRSRRQDDDGLHYTPHHDDHRDRRWCGHPPRHPHRSRDRPGRAGTGQRAVPGRHRPTPADTAGYTALLAWMQGFGTIGIVGVEGTGAYGAGLARYLREQGMELAEVDRPDRKTRRFQGRSDPIDAIQAAKAALAADRTGTPKSGRWPDGYICRNCADRALRTWGACPECGQDRTWSCPGGRAGGRSSSALSGSRAPSAPSSSSAWRAPRARP